MLKLASTSLAALLASMAIAHAGPINQLSYTPQTELQASAPNVVLVGSKRSNLTAKQKLDRVLRPHTFRYPITREIRRAAGNPNMAVLDRRKLGFAGTFHTHRCSFITLRGQRAILCES